jgi:hypothetical protein
MTEGLDWSAVQAFLYRRPVVPTTDRIGAPVVLPVAGSAEWCALDDADDRKSAALLVAGSRWVLQQQLDQLDAGRAARKDAATEISQARDWSAVAKRIRDRDDAHRRGAFIPRKAS